MISDHQTNTVYFSELLRTDPNFSETANEIVSILDSFNVDFRFLPNTKDIWARDYMPIQVDDEVFIEYRYDPDYLQGKEKGCRNLKTYPDIVCDSIKLQTVKSDIILDGGNVVKSSDCVILTDKVVKENKFHYSKGDLVEKIQRTFQVNKVVLIPSEEDYIDEYGHSDGMVRFIDNETVLVNDFCKKDTVLVGRLKRAGLKVEFLDFQGKRNDELNWAYINFLQTSDLIILPKLGIEEDDKALEQIGNLYSGYNGKIAQVAMNNIVKDGGALNCITWTIKI